MVMTQIILRQRYKQSDNGEQPEIMIHQAILMMENNQETMIQATQMMENSQEIMIHQAIQMTESNQEIMIQETG